MWFNPVSLPWRLVYLLGVRYSIDIYDNQYIVVLTFIIDRSYIDVVIAE